MTPSDQPTPTAALEPELRAISDTFLAQLERLQALEERKRLIPVDDPSFPTIALEVEEAARALLGQAGRQRNVAHEIHDEAVAEGATGTIEEIPPEMSAARILAQWREVERQLAETEAGSPRARDLERRSQAFRTAYQRAYEAARDAHPKG
ncbi:MAG: hypothetical protein U0869_08970 [Chloroflexota bacterium]